MRGENKTTASLKHILEGKMEVVCASEKIETSPSKIRLEM